jgi:hypothetical protein
MSLITRSESEHKGSTVGMIAQIKSNISEINTFRVPGPNSTPSFRREHEIRRARL